jgi:hypothetical protein
MCQQLLICAHGENIGSFRTKRATFAEGMAAMVATSSFALCIMWHVYTRILCLILLRIFFRLLKEQVT